MRFCIRYRNMEIQKEKKLRYGFTTGSCATAAAKAAAYMLLSGNEKKEISIVTPKGIVFETELLDINRKEYEVSCAVKKDAGDDPDVTDGILIYARVYYCDGKEPGCRNGEIKSEDDECTDNTTRQEHDRCRDSGITSEDGEFTEDIVTQDEGGYGNGEITSEDDECAGGIIGQAYDRGRDGECTDNTIQQAKSRCAEIVITGGEGIGRVTLPGLDQPVGEYAINHVPREMIAREVAEVSALFDCDRPLSVEIYAPEGVHLAEKTFNPRLGIVGGISILGTSGIVEPMSEKALVDTIKTELSVKKALGEKTAVVSPGNYGLDFIRANYDYDLDRAVKCSNFIGDTIRMSGEMGFDSIILVGHVGKLVKLAAGMLNTHSKYGDHRMEVIREEAEKAGFPEECCERISNCISTDAAIDVLDEYEKSALTDNKDTAIGQAVSRGKSAGNTVMKSIMDRIMSTLEKVNDTDMRLYCIMFSNKAGLLASSAGAEEMMKNLTER